MSREFTLITKLREDIQTGEMTYSDIERRLSAAIEAEYSKDDADVDFINACEDLLLEMRTDGNLPVFPTAEQYAVQMRKHMQVKKERPFLPKLMWRCAAALAAMLVLVLLGDHVFHWEWFSGTSTKDEQQYVIQGHEVTAPMIAESIAEHEECDELLTDDWDEVVEFLGFVPSVPNPDSTGFDAIQYRVFVESASLSLAIHYQNRENNSKQIYYSVQYCSDVEEAYMLLEQNEEGNTELICGTNVYISKNVERNSFTWLNDTVVYCFSGNIDYECGNAIVKEIIGG